MKLLRSPVAVIIIVAAIMLTACSAPAANAWPGAMVSPDQGTVYLAYSSYVYSIQAKGGSMNWRYPSGNADANKTFYVVPALSNGLLIVGDYKNVLFGLDASSGAEKWTFKQSRGHFVAGALVAGNTILAPCGDGVLYALDMQGNLLWKFTASQALWSTPIFKGDVIYQTSMDHSIYAINLQDGSKLWSTNLGAAILSSPAIDANGILYIGTLGGEVYSINSKDGEIGWSFKASDAVWDRPVLKDDVLYFGDVSGKIYAISPVDGSLKWSISVNGAVIGAGGALSDGVVFGTEKGDVVNVSAGGEKLWTRTFSGKLYSDIVVAGDQILVPVAQGDKLLIVLDSKGNEAWSFVQPK